MKPVIFFMAGQRPAPRKLMQPTNTTYLNTYTRRHFFFNIANLASANLLSSLLGHDGVAALPERHHPRAPLAEAAAFCREGEACWIYLHMTIVAGRRTWIVGL